MAKKGRPRKSGPRDKRDRLLSDERRVEPAAYVTARRNLFAFVSPTKGPEGRAGTIDQDICDGIGQFHALGLLDGHGHDPQDLRDNGRAWRDCYTTLLRKSGYKIGGYETMDKGVAVVHYTHRDAKFDRMDEALTGFERSALLSLLVDPVVGSWPDGEDNAPWVRSLIGEALLKRGKIPPSPLRFPTDLDREMLNASIRGLVALIDASLPSRWEQTNPFRRSAA
jgi:hypothetical protein